MKNDEATGSPLGAEGYLYNITTQVAWGIHETWLAWMLDEFIPAMLGTGCFFKHQVVRLLDTDETEGPVYAVQYYIESKRQYDHFMQQYQPYFAGLAQEKWATQVFSFSSLMQVVN